MKSLKTIIFIILILFFLLFSFYPTIFELSLSNKLADPNREFILEHNYYWPDFNLYLSKIRQGNEGRLTALEKYTNEPHTGSLIQEFYVVLGLIGKFIGLDPNFSYQLGRILLSPLLLLIILLLIRFYFKSFAWQVTAFLIIIVSGSFPRFYTDSNNLLQVGRFMEWWSNIDALQRLTFIPHILFGQVVSFYLLYQITDNRQQITNKKIVIYCILGNLVGLVFPPSLITLDGVLILSCLLSFRARQLAGRGIFHGRNYCSRSREDPSTLPPKAGSVGMTNRSTFGLLGYCLPRRRDTTMQGYRPWEWRAFYWGVIGLFVILTLPSLLYLFYITKQLPWSALVEFHRTHPMMIPFGEYILGTGPVFFLGVAGAVVSIIQRNRRFQPLIFWLIVTFFFAILFTHLKEQSPLRFTQTGLFIPLGILGTYLLQQIWFFIINIKDQRSKIKYFLILCYLFSVICYLFFNLFMMKISLNWQTSWISQRIGATIPPVPYPPQAMYPLKAWMDAIRWLRDNTKHDDVVLAEVTAGNYIPAYSGNTVYFGQANTVDYNRKQMEMEKFYTGQLTASEAHNFLNQGRIKYIFFSLQEKEKSGGKPLETFYPFLKAIYTNNLVTIYTY